MLQLGLHPRDVDRLTADEFDFIAEAIESTRARTAANQQAAAVATMRAMGDAG